MELRLSELSEYVDKMDPEVAVAKGKTDI